MEDLEYRGKIVYLTPLVDTWLQRNKLALNIRMANRMAKVVKVFDWETEEGKLLLSTRSADPRWSDKDPTEHRFVLKIYHPELKKGKSDRPGVTVLEPMPRYLPGTKAPLFEVYPEWMLKDFSVEEKDIFKVVEKGPREKSSAAG